MNIEKRIGAVFGFSPGMLEESWVDEDGPSFLDFQVMQRALVALGFPTGKNGRCWIDGVISRHTRRALKQYQAEKDMGQTGRFSENTRLSLYADVADMLQPLSEQVVFGYAGQLNRVMHDTEFDGERTIFHYLQPARERVTEDLVPVFLTLLATVNHGVTLPSLDLADYRVRVDQGAVPAEARLMALRYGFFQLSGAFLSEHGEFDFDRARLAGDLEYHLDIVAYFLEKDEKVKKILRSGQLEDLYSHFPVGHMSKTADQNDFTSTLADINRCLAR